MSGGLLFSQMEPPAGQEAEFHDWYNGEHIPARMAIPGFESATRYEALTGEPRYLACYFLDDLGALDTPEYKELKANPGARTERMLGSVLGFTRYICESLSDTGPADALSGVLLATTFSVPVSVADEFEDWYEDEHVGLLMQVPGWIRVRRYRRRGDAIDGPPWTHFALHEIRDEATLDRPERAVARDTPRRDALASRDWFRDTGRWTYRPIHTATATHDGRKD
jgi:hypothetical protein